MKYWGRVQRRQPQHLLHNALKFNNCKLKIGRSCYTWITTIRRIVNKLGKSMIYWERKAKNKAEFHKEIMNIYEIPESETEEEPQSGTDGQDE